MSWMEKLYQTYVNNTNHIGDVNDKIPLLPVGHALQNAQVEIIISDKGCFMDASIVPKADAPTIVPCTEESASRTGKAPVNHPLFDKLQYIARDFRDFGGEVTLGFKERQGEPHNTYVKQLAEWCLSPYKHPKVLAVQIYVNKGYIVDDLVKAGILPVDDTGRLLKMRPDKSDKVPEIFRVISTTSRAEDAFVRWIVEIPGDQQPRLWQDESVRRSWIDYCATKESDKGLCYVTGEQHLIAEKHPKGIYAGAYNAKLISSNDTDGFTFLGRFTTSKEACGIGYDVTQKAHSALKWLISRQGHYDGRQAIVAWAVSGATIPDILSDTQDLLSDSVNRCTLELNGYTAQEIGLKL